MKKTIKSPEDRIKFLNGLVRNNCLANAKNISDWYMAEDMENGGTLQDQVVQINAGAGWYLSDYVYAVKQFRTMLENPYQYHLHPKDHDTIIQRLKDFAEFEKQAPSLDCSDERLKEMIHRLLYVYSAINKPIHVYVADSEEAYHSFFQEHFKEDIYDYKKFMATCIYYDPSVYWMVVKTEHLAKMDDTVLLGMCAHEMAHLDIVSKSTIAVPFQSLRNYQQNDMFINERLTDLYAMGHGFAYCLYKSRQFWGSSPYVFSAEDIESYILKIEKIATE